MISEIAGHAPWYCYVLGITGVFLVGWAVGSTFQDYRITRGYQLVLGASALFTAFALPFVFWYGLNAAIEWRSSRPYPLARDEARAAPCTCIENMTAEDIIRLSYRAKP